MIPLDLVPVGLAERNPMVLRRFDNLVAGETLELTLDAPPWVIFHQLRTERLDRFDWEDVLSGPDRWVVRIHKRT